MTRIKCILNLLNFIIWIEGTMHIIQAMGFQPKIKQWRRENAMKSLFF